ncbi:unnamed protein product [Tilletia controversa]|uniref:Uncharacterized protein n=3 Tax=Tilletia TaxID=13289 RepID=A0A8X7MQX9_9BASI|nr:hypothetical protein CF328_g4812 [Tilletia controversa]KAE8197940.1 hypothetical protein CF335_g4499 [Tilletia laevis]KAE8262764.1 hypothetical protein A4X03_0g2198 [Tilletia caries]KAE8245452.1 hypothetical protein A4X06_0g5678 [Tilletia controversa]CAD6890975.1 unnamed protein product [Tilletia caries]
MFSGLYYYQLRFNKPTARTQLSLPRHIPRDNPSTNDGSISLCGKAPPLTLESNTLAAPSGNAQHLDARSMPLWQAFGLGFVLSLPFGAAAGSLGGFIHNATVDKADRKKTSPSPAVP